MHIRNKEKQEIDFVLVKNNKPVTLFEAKESDGNKSKSMIYFIKNYPALLPIVQNRHKIEIFPANCTVIPATNIIMLTG